ncbi:MAG TPA: RDD family protein [Streptosporangiaceae bacterium]|nr:RDD family protein [Streptosporangiaceae bacterium]
MAEVVTGEAVIIDVPTASFPSRMLAQGIDMAVQLVTLAVLLGLVVAPAAGGGLDAAATAAVVLAVMVAAIVGYPVVFETLSRGKSLGKLAMGLRVVSDDGGPERFRQALMRALAAVVEIWATLGFLALVTSVISTKSKRLGDIFGGTFVIQERLPARAGMSATLAPPPPALAGWAATLELSGLTDTTAETARQFLSRYYELTPAAREEFGARIAIQVATQVTPAPPPGISAPDYLSAVLAERRGREHARMMGAGFGHSSPGSDLRAADGGAGAQTGTGDGSQVSPAAPPAASTRPGGFLPPI